MRSLQTSECGTPQYSRKKQRGRNSQREEVGEGGMYEYRKKKKKFTLTEKHRENISFQNSIIVHLLHKKKKETSLTH